MKLIKSRDVLSFDMYLKLTKIKYDIFNGSLLKLGVIFEHAAIAGLRIKFLTRLQSGSQPEDIFLASFP